MKVSEFSAQFNIEANLKSVDDDPYLLYFLVKDGAIVYVGKSNEFGFSGRLRSHKADKDYDSYFTMNSISNEAQALELEKGFISLIRPEYNKAEKAVNMRAIRALIQYVTSAPKSYVPQHGQCSSSDLDRARGKVRAYRSRIAASEAKGETPSPKAVEGLKQAQLLVSEIEAKLKL
jgi:hypothetical protein